MMKDSAVIMDSTIDSPARNSMNNVTSCYNRSLFKADSFVSSRRAFQTGADKISTTFRTVKNTFGNLSRHFRLSGRRRHRLNETSSPMQTPISKKEVLGRSPAKLYSPFGIETPHHRDCRMSPYMPDTPEHGLSPKRRGNSTTSSWRNILNKKRRRALFN